MGYGRGGRYLRAAQDCRGARGRARRRAHRSEPGLRGPPPARARVFGLRVAARRGRHAARPRRSPLRGAVPVRTFPRRDRRQEPDRPHRSRSHPGHRRTRGDGRAHGVGEPAATRRARIRRGALVRG